MIGSGPSIEAGYPSWPKLAKRAYEVLKEADKINDDSSYQKYLKNNQYPELFMQVQRDLGGRPQLVKLIASLLVPEAGGTHHIYDLLAMGRA